MIEMGKIDTANTAGSVRSVALSEGLQSVLDQWCRVTFPETREPPLSKGNCWRRWFEPRLEPTGASIE